MSQWFSLVIEAASISSNKHVIICSSPQHRLHDSEAYNCYSISYGITKDAKVDVTLRSESKNNFRVESINITVKYSVLTWHLD